MRQESAEQPVIRPEFQFPPNAAAICNTVEEAEALVTEFTTEFPDSDVYLMVTPSKTRSPSGQKIWKVNFHGKGVNNDMRIASWLKAKGIIR